MNIGCCSNRGSLFVCPCHVHDEGRHGVDVSLSFPVMFVVVVMLSEQRLFGSRCYSLDNYFVNSVYCLCLKWNERMTVTAYTLYTWSTWHLSRLFCILWLMRQKKKSKPEGSDSFNRSPKEMLKFVIILWSRDSANKISRRVLLCLVFPTLF